MIDSIGGDVAYTFHELGSGATEGLRVAGRLGDKELIFCCLLGCAEVAAQRGDPVRATRLLGVADALCEEMGFAPGPLEQKQRWRIETALDRDNATLTARSEGRALPLDDAVAYALEGHEPA